MRLLTHRWACLARPVWLSLTPSHTSWGPQSCLLTGHHEQGGGNGGRTYPCVFSADAHSPPSHQIVLTEHKFQDKVIRHFRMVAVEHCPCVDPAGCGPCRAGPVGNFLLLLFPHCWGTATIVERSLGLSFPGWCVLRK